MSNQRSPQILIISMKFYARISQFLIRTKFEYTREINSNLLGREDGHVLQMVEVNLFLIPVYSIKTSESSAL